MNGGKAKTLLPTETTGITPKSALLKGFSFSELLTEEAYISNDALPITPKRRYTYSVF